VKIESDGTILGAVYEVEPGQFRYECEECCTAFFGGDEYRLELKADQHDEWHRHQEEGQR
jgi:hypothetical protein